MTPKAPRSPRSLVLKITALSLLSGVTVTALALASLGVATGIAPVRGDQLVGVHTRRYMGYLRREIGLPPSEAVVHRLATELGCAVRVDYHGLVTASETGLPSPAEVEHDGYPGLVRWGVPQGRIHGRVYVLDHDPANGADYLYLMPYGASLEVRDEWMLVFVGLTVLVMLLSYLAVRRVLKPLALLGAGVKRLAGGDLAYRLPAYGDAELALLAAQLNAMSTRLSEMLDAKEQLLLDVSHELRSPLTRLKLALELAPPSPGVAGMAADVGVLERMTAELLEAARLGSPHGKLRLERVDLAGLLTEVVSGLTGRAPGITLAPVSGPLLASVDAARTRTVMLNVLENALKYSPPGAAAVAVRAQVADGGVVIAVHDHGSGVPPEDVERVFEPFYRIDKARTPATGGFGLGLSLCKRIMEAQRGSITLQSSAEGTLVTLRFQGA